jgi:hypothetical protein
MAEVWDAAVDITTDVGDWLGDIGTEVVGWIDSAGEVIDPAEMAWNDELWDYDFDDDYLWYSTTEGIGEAYDSAGGVSELDFTLSDELWDDDFDYGEALTEASGYDNEGIWVGEGVEPGASIADIEDAAGIDVNVSELEDYDPDDDVDYSVGDGVEPGTTPTPPTFLSKAAAKAKQLAADKAKQFAEAQARKLLGGTPVSSIPSGLPTGNQSVGLDPNILLAVIAAGRPQQQPVEAPKVADIPDPYFDVYSGNIDKRIPFPDPRDPRVPVRTAAQGGIIKDKTAEILRILGNKDG